MKTKICMIAVLLLSLGCVSIVHAEEAPSVVTKISMDFENAALKDVLKAFSRQSGINFISSNIIEGKVVTVYLNNVTTEEALYAILEANGLAYEKEAGNVYLIKPSGTEHIKTVTRVFKLNYLQVYKMTVENQAYGSTSVMTIIGEPAIQAAGSATSTAANAPPAAAQAPGADQPKNIIEIVRTLMSKYGKIVADRRNNSLIITDIPGVFPPIEATIKALDVEPMQVFIQAEIIETTTTALKRIGIEYGSEDYLAKATYTGSSSTTAGTANTTNPTFPTPFPFTENFIKDVYNTNMAASGLFRYGTIQISDIDVVLKLFAQDEDTKYLSRPKIMTINNEPAIIKVAANTAIGKTSSSITQTGQTISTAERAETGIMLKVTPQVNDKGYIFLYLEPFVARAQASEFFTLDFLDPQYRSSSSIVMVKDGDTAVIGGLIETNNFKTTRKIPILGDIPILGEPFKSKYRKADDTELLIFVTPHVVSKRDGQYIIPPELTERERMLEKALNEHEKKKPASGKKKEKAPTALESAKRDKAMEKALKNYSKKETANTDAKNK